MGRSRMIAHGTKQDIGIVQGADVGTIDGRGSYVLWTRGSDIEAKVRLWKHEGAALVYSFGTPTYTKLNGRKGPLGIKQYEKFRLLSLNLLEVVERRLLEAGWKEQKRKDQPDNKLATQWYPPQRETGHA